MIGINTELKKLAAELFIKYRSKERASITTSLFTLESRLNAEYGYRIDELLTFGSYTRDTILPRRYDYKSDVDLMIIYNTTLFPDKTEATYRKNLKKFTEKWYHSSQIYKSFPTVVLELNHIKFDLVPAVKQNTFWGTEKLYIPDTDGYWQETNPLEFKSILTRVNSSNNSIIKPLIRIMKGWNAKAKYPFASYDLEQIIAGMRFSYGSDLHDGFFQIVNQIPYPNNSKDNKVDSLKYNVSKAFSELEQHNYHKAMNWLKKVLPIY